MRFGTKSQSTVRLGYPIIPLINVALLLLVFFVWSLKINGAQDLGQRNIPIGQRPVAVVDHSLSEIKVGLRSDRAGNLTRVTLGSIDLGNDDAAFDRLNAEILGIVSRSGNPLRRDIEVEIDADYETQYKYVVRAVAKCSGRYDPETRQVTRYVEKIKFAAPHQPQG